MLPLMGCLCSSLTSAISVAKHVAVGCYYGGRAEKVVVWPDKILHRATAMTVLHQATAFGLAEG